MKALINGLYNSDGSAAVGEIRVTDKAVVVMSPEAFDSYGILEKKRSRMYNKKYVEEALAFDGWASLGEIENSETVTAADWLAERVRDHSHKS